MKDESQLRRHDAEVEKEKIFFSIYSDFLRSLDRLFGGDGWGKRSDLGVTSLALPPLFGREYLSHTSAVGRSVGRSAVSNFFFSFLVLLSLQLPEKASFLCPREDRDEAKNLIIVMFKVWYHTYIVWLVGTIRYNEM